MREQISVYARIIHNGTVWVHGEFGCSSGEQHNCATRGSVAHRTQWAHN